MGETSENLARGLDTYSFRQPLGVTAGICPFNFPAMIPMWMFSLATVCGNSMIVKPVSQCTKPEYYHFIVEEYTIDTFV